MTVGHGNIFQKERFSRKGFPSESVFDSKQQPNPNPKEHKMANPLLSMLKNLFIETKKAAEQKDSNKLEATTQNLKSLSMKLDVQFRTLNGEWTRENAALFNRPAAQRTFYRRTTQALKRRMMLVAQYKSMVDRCLGTIAAAQDWIKYSKELEGVNLDPATMASLQQSVSEAQLRVNQGMEQMELINTTIDSTLQAAESSMGMDVLSESERKEQELWDRYDTCMAAGDEKGAKAAKAEIDKLNEAELATI